MGRRLGFALGALFGLAFLAVAYVSVGLFLAHRQIRNLDPELPEVDAILAFDPAADLPVSLSWLNTASQKMPRSAVLEPSLDPTPDASYTMAHASFVLEWSDGRIFLVDAGMDRDAALDFGKPLELLAGAEPMVPLGSIAEKLGASLQRVEAIAFTHEHADHTQGVAALCRLHTKPLRLIQNRLQFEQSNYTTRGAQKQIAEAPCLEREVAEGGPLFAVRGFPGLAFFAAAGHTPGSQVFVAHVRGSAGVRTYLLTGDVVNQIDGVRGNIPKPRLYEMLVVPEAPERLDALRRLLAELERDHGASLLVSHDQLSLEASGVRGE
ncbi:MAG: MBL fold metallo-hydrolase [Deltaproteobacteria bacterium]|nr:MBL fold metallo-hydrolase [Deltaproteobacteria bacterium]